MITEVAELHVNGTVLRDWTSVEVVAEWAGEPRRAKFSLAESDPVSKDFTKLRVKPGDQCTVYLAGELAFTGYVFLRQAAYDAERHGVMIMAVSKPGALVESSVVDKVGQFRGYTWDQIARRVAGRYGVNLKMLTAPGAPFENVQVNPGETVYNFLERLARMRGIYLTDDVNGNLVGATKQTEASIDRLVEGVNILSARCTIRDDALAQQLIGLGQAQGNDTREGKDTTQINASTRTSKTRPSTYLFMAERPVTRQDLMRRLEFEAEWREATTIDCEITLQGWLRSTRKLWNPGDVIGVKSPSLIINQDLKVRVVSFRQTSQSGTTTTLNLMPPGKLPMFESYKEADTNVDFTQ